MATDPEPESRYTLKEAAERFFPGGTMTVSGLRTEHRKKRLRIERVAGKDYVTASAISDMLKACVVQPKEDDQCRVRESRPASISAPDPEPLHTGSSSTERKSLAQERLHLTLQKLKKPSGTTSSNGTSRREGPPAPINS